MKCPILFIILFFLQVYVYSQIPKSFDLRDKSTSVKNQNSNSVECSSSWAFAVASSIESTFKLDGNITDIDLSEDNIIDCQCYTKQSCVEGNFDMVNALFSVHKGPFDEQTDKYTPTVSDCSNQFLNPLAYVEDIRFIPSSNNRIKEQLLKNIEVASEMIFDPLNYDDINFKYYSQQLNKGESLNKHFVSIVGWDDDMQFYDAPTPGGWIVKNSFGPNWGDKGYFYVSYYDAGITKFNNVIFPTYYKIPHSKNISEPYYYDLYGCVDYKGFDSNVAFGLVKYTIGKNQCNLPQQIKRIATWAVKDNTTIKIELFTSFLNGVLSEPIASTSQFCEFKGCYSIPLPTKTLPTGTTVFIKVSYLAPKNTSSPIPVEIAKEGCTKIPIPLSNNECWISPNGNEWQLTGQKTTNAFDLCIKMYTEIAPLAKINLQKLSFCYGDDILLTSPMSNYYDNVKWFVNDVEIGNSFQLKTKIGSPFKLGENKITIVPIYGENRDTASVSINVNPLPEVTVEKFFRDKVSVDSYAMELPQGSPVGGWYLCDGVHGNYFYPSNGVGNYELMYYYTDNSTGCSNSATTVINVVEKSEDNESKKQEIVEIYPERSPRILSVKIHTDEKCIITIQDHTGKEILQTINPPEIDLTNLSSGTYFIEINIEGLYYKKKMLKL